MEVLAENGFSAPAVEAFLALSRLSAICTSQRRAYTHRNANISYDTVAELEVRYILSDLDDVADGFVARNKLLHAS